MLGLSATQATGILLVAGAAIFLGIIVAALVATVRTGSLPFKGSSGVQAIRQDRSASKPRSA